MTRVVDASVLVAALVDAGQAGQWAEAALAAGPLAGPELALVEASNTLRRLERAGEISRLEATSAHRDLLRLALELFPLRAVCRARLGITGQPDQLRRLVCSPRRGARLSADDAGPPAQPRQRPSVRHYGAVSLGVRIGKK